MEERFKSLIRVPEMIEDAKWARKESLRIRRKVDLIEEKHLPRLKRTLAAFNTNAMPFVQDLSVVLEK